MKTTYEAPRILTMSSSEVLEALGPVQGYGFGRGQAHDNSSASQSAGPSVF